MKRFLILSVLIVALVGALSPSTTQAQGATWSAQFFDNPYFIGDPDFTETRNAVDFNWGTNAPRSGFPADNYTVRISSDIYFPAGNYRFYLLADDGATVTFNFNQPIINTFDNPRVGETLQGDLNLDRSGVYHIQIDYKENAGNAYIYFAYENLADGVQGPPFPVLGSGGTPTTPPPANLAPLGNAFWTGQFYPNRDLSGSPVAITSNSGLKISWGFGSPVGNVPVDNFSARWNAVYSFDGGDYYLQVTADDGVRVYLDGVLLINEWRDATGASYGTTIRPVAGNHTVTVEYYEAYGTASIDFQAYDVLAQAAPNPGTSPYGAFATVTASRLNVRDFPSASTGNVISRISQGETYPIVGKNGDSTWVQIATTTVTGWVSAAYTNNTNLANVPVTSGQAQQPQQPAQPTDYTAFTRTEVNLRTAPTTSASRILIVPQNVTVEIVGRNTRATWWQVRYNGTTGWVSASYAVIQQQNPDLNRIPITG